MNMDISNENMEGYYGACRSDRIGNRVSRWLLLTSRVSETDADTRIRQYV